MINNVITDIFKETTIGTFIIKASVGVFWTICALAGMTYVKFSSMQEEVSLLTKNFKTLETQHLEALEKIKVLENQLVQFANINGQNLEKSTEIIINSNANNTWTVYLFVGIVCLIGFGITYTIIQNSNQALLDSLVQEITLQNNNQIETMQELTKKSIEHTTRVTEINLKSTGDVGAEILNRIDGAKDNVISNIIETANAISTNARTPSNHRLMQNLGDYTVSKANFDTSFLNLTDGNTTLTEVLSQTVTENVSTISEVTTMASNLVN